MDTFDRKDEFYRAIKRSQPSVVCEDGAISSALFKNEDVNGNPGISVDCQDGRQREVAISFMRDWFAPRLKGVVGFTYEDVTKVKAAVFRSPSTTNPFHAEIYQDEGKGHISNIQAIWLAKQCKLYYFDEDTKWTK